MIIENRPGASGNLGAQAVADAEPDGYTLLHTTVATQALNPILMPSSKLRPLKDLVAVGTTAALPNVLVVQPKKIEASSVQQLVELGKTASKSLNYGTFGHGTSPHILSLLLQRKAGFEAVAVAYRGSAPLSRTSYPGKLIICLTTSLRLQSKSKRELYGAWPSHRRHAPRFSQTCRR